MCFISIRQGATIHCRGDYTLAGISSYIVLYIDDLLQMLAQSKVACYICCICIGTLAYGDDVVLLAPAASAVCKMLPMCYKYTVKYSYNTPRTTDANKCFC